jgi:hypothetical protein
MHFYDDEEDERERFSVFGDLEPEFEPETTPDPVQELNLSPADEPATIEPEAPRKTGGFSWAGFAGGLAAFAWIAAAIAGPLGYFGVDGVMAMDPAMQAGLVALAFGPALLFWLTASAAGEAVKARRLAAELAHAAHGGSLPIYTAGEAQAKRLTETVKQEIDVLNDSVATALKRLEEFENAARRNAAWFDTAVASSRENTEAMAMALQHERNAIAELNGELKGQTETLSHSVGRQVRLMREASKLVQTEVAAAEDALEGHLDTLTTSAHVLGERTAAIHAAAEDASAVSVALNSTLNGMLDGLAEATRLTDTARQSTESAVIAANETAAAVRETTRNAVFEAKRAAQLIRAEASAMQDAAADTLAKLQEAALAARAASEESQAAADRHAASIEKRLGALASTAAVKKVPAPQARIERPVERTVERVETPVENSLQAAANAAIARGAARERSESKQQPKPVFKGFNAWNNFMPPREHAKPAPVREELDLVSFNARDERLPDAMLKDDALELVTEAGVDLDEVLGARALALIAQSSRHGAAARREAVASAAPVAVSRIARHVKRHSGARAVASAFRARPDLAKGEQKGEGSVVRAYLLIDAALD